MGFWASLNPFSSRNGTSDSNESNTSKKKGSLQKAIAAAAAAADKFNKVAIQQRLADRAAAEVVKLSSKQEELDDTDFDSEDDDLEAGRASGGAHSGQHESESAKLAAELETAKEERQTAKNQFKGMCNFVGSVDRCLLRLT